MQWLKITEGLASALDGFVSLIVLSFLSAFSISEGDINSSEFLSCFSSLDDNFFGFSSFAVLSPIAN